MFVEVPLFHDMTIFLRIGRNCFPSLSWKHRLEGKSIDLATWLDVVPFPGCWLFPAALLGDVYLTSLSCVCVTAVCTADRACLMESENYPR
jgi:hypothetical protein